MPGWVAVLFWIWLVVSLVILVVRRVNRRRASLAEGAPIGSPEVTGPHASSPAAPPSAREWPAPPPPDPDDDTYRMEPGTSTAQAAAHSPGSAVPSARPSEGLAEPGASASAPAPVPRSTLPELLAGITLPHELVPLTQVEVAVDLATHVVVATEKASAEAVTTGMRDELEKLGYEVEQESMLQLRATGERGIVLVEVHADGAAAVAGSVRRFPTATEGMVVVEIWAG